MISTNNFGLSGQESREAYDSFFCLGKRCKQRKKEKHDARIARKNSKIDARKADTERVRAETQVIQQAASPSPSNPIITMPLTRQEVTYPSAMSSTEKGNNGTTKDGFTNNAIFIIIGVLVLGGFLYQSAQKKQVAMKQNKVSLAA